MLKSLWSYILFIVDFFLPERQDFTIVKKFNEKAIFSLPKSQNIRGLDWIQALFNYKDNRVRAIIWELKYKENIVVLGHIGKMIYDELLSQISEIKIFDNDAEFVLLPIPITGVRRSERGYNQAEHIAKAVLENDIEHNLLYAPQWFQKIKDTPKQSHAHAKEERMKNLLDSFYADDRLGGKYVILIDDVITTGSTFIEARKTLLAKGVKDVFAFAIAH